MNAHLRLLRENLVEKLGESVENKPLVGKTC